MTRHLTLAVLLCAAALGACDKNAVQQLPLGPIATARIRFFNFGVGAPGVNFYADATKLTAISSTTNQEATIGVAYGAAGNAGLYSSIAPGTYTLTGRIAATTNKDLPIDTLSAGLADGNAYSFFLSGFYNTTTKLTDAFIVDDPIPAQADYSVAYVRFVNAIGNANPMTLYARLADSTVAADTIALSGPVAYQGVGPFTAVPNGVYNLITRYADSTAAISRTNVSFVRGHAYTVGARGDVTKTSGSLAPVLDNSANW